MELIHKIYDVFSNIHEVHCRPSDIDEQGVVFDIYVKTTQKTAFNEYDELIEWMIHNTVDVEFNRAIILVHRI